MAGSAYLTDTASRSAFDLKASNLSPIVLNRLLLTPTASRGHAVKRRFDESDQDASQARLLICFSLRIWISSPRQAHPSQSLQREGRRAATKRRARVLLYDRWHHTCPASTIPYYPTHRAGGLRCLSRFSAFGQRCSARITIHDWPSSTYSQQYMRRTVLVSVKARVFSEDRSSRLIA